jgi:tRNA dimethylallyltransferase
MGGERVTSALTPARVLVIAGPTASGKSGLALAAAERLGGRIVNADSMQVYRDLAILTARPAAEDLARAPHALYGILDGAEPCSAARWATLAREEIRATLEAGEVPILCGGTGLYLRTLLHGIAPVPEIPAEIRAAATARHAELGGEAFRQELAQLDPVGAERLRSGDTQRLIRAWEVATATGRPLSDWQREGRENALGLPVHAFTLLPPRPELYAATDGRLVRMVEAGAVEEVRRLLARGLDPALPVMKAVPELGRYIAGEIGLDEAVAQAQQATRRYAKRQYTWFRHQFPEAEIVSAQFSERNAGLLCQKICISA